jgi:anti-sigma B factor antagonist
MKFDFSLETEAAGPERSVIAVAGEIDIFTAPDLRAAVVAAIDGGTRELVIDLSDVHFLDSTALGVLIGTLKRLRTLGGRLVVVNSEPTTARTFEITGLDQTLSITETRDEALVLLADPDADAAATR